MKSLIGIDYLGVSCVKITKSPYDPVTTPDSQVSAFYYNSKWSADVRVHYLNTLPYDPTSFLFPPGTNRDTCTWEHLQDAPRQTWTDTFRGAHFTGLLYKMPLLDVKELDQATGRYQNGRIIPTFTGFGTRGGIWATKNATWTKDQGGFIAGAYTFMEYAFIVQSDWYVPSGSTIGIRRQFVLWNMPGDETAITDGTPATPTAGQRVVEINATACRVAKPGYDVRTATPTQLAFDSSVRPVKIVASGDISVPTGYSEYETGLMLPANTVIDLVCYSGSTVYYPCNPQDTDFGAEYWISGSKIAFNNPNPGCRARFAVLAFDDTPQVSGANNVFTQTNIGGQDVIQFLRPGSGSPPSFADIILDSRWPSLQILAEGYIPVTVNGHQTFSVPISAAGMFPIVKYMTVHPGVGGTYGWSKQIRSPKVSRIGINPTGAPWVYYEAGDSTYCTVTTTDVTFHTYRGNPTRVYYANASQQGTDTRSFDFDGAPIQGIRYFILGVPA